jgi:hypothetical protein
VDESLISFPARSRAVPHTIPFDLIQAYCYHSTLGREEEEDCALDGPDASSHHANHDHKASKVHDINAELSSVVDTSN